MPGHLELKKDAPNGETLRGAVRKQRSADIRMGKPGMVRAMSSVTNVTREAPGELKHLSSRRKRKQK